MKAAEGQQPSRIALTQGFTPLECPRRDRKSRSLGGTARARTGAPQIRQHVPVIDDRDADGGE
jgi:hypothetical protein